MNFRIARLLERGRILPKYQVAFRYSGPWRIEIREHFRDKLATIQLINLATAEWLILEEINNGMREGFHYKEIYRRARDRVEALGRVIGKTLPAGHERIGTAANCSRAIESA